MDPNGFPRLRDPTPLRLVSSRRPEFKGNPDDEYCYAVLERIVHMRQKLEMNGIKCEFLLLPRTVWSQLERHLGRFSPIYSIPMNLNDPDGPKLIGLRVKLTDYGGHEITVCGNTCTSDISDIDQARTERMIEIAQGGGLV